MRLGTLTHCAKKKVTFEKQKSLSKNLTDFKSNQIGSKPPKPLMSNSDALGENRPHFK